jgi:hypothetical protein
MHFGAWIPNSSFSTGMGSALDFRGSFYDYDMSTPGWMRDVQSLKSDWQRVGDDFRFALNEGQKLLPETLNSSR